MPENATAEAPATSEPAFHAVIAARRFGPTRDWTGRYLHDAVSIAETAEKLCQIVRQRHHANPVTAAQHLLDHHPAGWRRLGTATAKDPEPKIRRSPAPIGACLCHEPDGSPTPPLIASGLTALSGIEYDRVVRPPGYLPGTDPTAAGYWTITRQSPLPPGTNTLFLLGQDALVIGARGNGHPGFVRIGTVMYNAPDPRVLDAISASAEKIAARSNDTVQGEIAAVALERARTVLEKIPAHHDLVLYLASQAGGNLARMEAALARRAGVHPADLPGHLHRLDRQAQNALLSATADQLHPERHHTGGREEI